MPDLVALGHQAAQEEHAIHSRRSAACLGLHRLDAALVGTVMQLSVRAAAAAVAKMPVMPTAGAVTRTDAETRAVAVRAVYSKAQEAVQHHFVCQGSSAEQASDLGSVCKSQRQQQLCQGGCCL